MNSEVIGIGEFLWDMLPSGPKMGGAPANFACHARSLGADAMVISRVGADSAGHDLVARLATTGVSTAGISTDPAHPTGKVEVELGEDGQPSYTIQENAAWDRLETTGNILEIAIRASAICFGTLGQRSEKSRVTIRRILELSGKETLKVFDANLRQSYFSKSLIHESMKLADVVKLNDEELELIAPMLEIAATEPRGQLKELAERYDLRLIACTRGSKGSLLYQGGSICEHPGLDTRVADTIGAGDAFTAALTMGLLKAWPLAQISDAANRIASYVCSCSGATPPLPEHLQKPFTPGALAS